MRRSGPRRAAPRRPARWLTRAVIFGRRRALDAAGEVDGEIEVAARAGAIGVDRHQHRPPGEGLEHRDRLGAWVKAQARARAGSRAHADAVIERLGVAAAQRRGGARVGPVGGGRLAVAHAGGTSACERAYCGSPAPLAARIAPVEAGGGRVGGCGAAALAAAASFGGAAAAAASRAAPTGSWHAACDCPSPRQTCYEPLRRSRRRVHQHGADEPCIYSDELKGPQ